MRQNHASILAVASLVLLTVSAGPATRPAPPEGEGFRFAPAGPKHLDPAICAALMHSDWVHRTPRNILGEGSETILRFMNVAQDGAVDVRRTSVQYGRAPDPPAQTTRTDAGRIDGPVLAYGDERQTFALVPGRELALRVVVPVGERRWYFAYVEHSTSGPIRALAVEYLFEFRRDPLAENVGKVRLTDRRGERVTTIDNADFNVVADKAVRHVSIENGGATLFRMTIAPGGQWASLSGPTEFAFVFEPQSNKTGS